MTRICLVTALFVLAACGGQQTTTTTARVSGPAAAHCAQKGGKTQMVRRNNAETPYCRLPDGRFVAQDVLYRARLL